jgi:tRNA threonylcarbamoyladenosine modification (KEOPS) complex Cgi121 subunit
VARKRKAFFSGEKTQKTFAIEAFGADTGVRQIAKSFCFFFQKEALPLIAA